MPFMENFGLSLSVNSPYGLTTEWDSDWAGKYRAHYTNLSSVFITPAISYRPFEWLSLSAGPQIVYVEAEMRKFIPTRLGDVYTEINGHDWSQGYVVSAMARPDDDWSFGVTFHSHVNFNIEGHADYDLPVLPPPYDSIMAGSFPRSHLYLPLDLPKTLSIAASTTAIRNFRFSAEVLWTGWSSYRDLKFNYEEAPGTGQPGVVKMEKRWNDVFSLHFGVEYYLDDQWTFRASYAWDDSPIEDDYRDPSLPTNDRSVFGFGLGWAWNQLSVDAAYSYVYVEDARPGSKVTPELHGTYEGDAHIANLSFSWTF
jgi:long-chain fatty acid transport protein